MEVIMGYNMKINIHPKEWVFVLPYLVGYR